VSASLSLQPVPVRPPEEDAIAVHIDDFGLPSVLICKFKVPLYYGNAEFFVHRALSIVRSAPLRPRWLSFDLILLTASIS
jgi:hypothetical protein